MKRVARCRITFINHKNIISFLLIFSFCLTYINYVMACQNKCNIPVMYPVLHTCYSFGKCPARLLAPIQCTVMRRIPMIQSTMDRIYDGGPIRL